ncbi:MAG: FTR1 family protein [Planctomycetes bacterium]|nr:FTR1 family protein [Planctomycetota bacterium]
MATSFLLSLREGLEAALIIGIVLSVLRKMERQKLNSTVWIGALSAGLVSILAAIGLNWIGAEFKGQGEQLFEGITMLLAASVLTWMVFWMRKQFTTIKQEIELGVRQATQGQGQRALFFLAFLPVVREGIELALFLLAARLTSNPFQEFLGAGLGLTSAALIGWIVFATSRRLSLSRFFQSTNVLLALFAAGLVGLGIHEFNELGWIPAFIEHVWNLNAFLPEESTLGQLLKALIGYNSSPSLSQVIAYLGYFGVLGGIFWARRQTALVQEPVKK